MKHLNEQSNQSFRVTYKPLLQVLEEQQVKVPEQKTESVSQNRLDEDGEYDAEVGSGESEDEEDEDDGGGWITPSNIKKVQMDVGSWQATGDMKVGCVTTDFAMQVYGGNIWKF